jgi:hypothetical protein
MPPPSRQAVALAVLVLALPLAGAASTPSPVSPARASGDGAVLLADAPLQLDAASLQRALRGPIASIASIAAVPDAAGWFDVVIAGDDAPASRTLRVGAKGRLPFKASSPRFVVPTLG